MLFPEKSCYQPMSQKVLCGSRSLILVSPVLLWIAVSRTTLQVSIVGRPPKVDLVFFLTAFLVITLMPACVLSLYEFNSQHRFIQTCQQGFGSEAFAQLKEMKTLPARRWNSKKQLPVISRDPNHSTNSNQLTS